MHTPSPLGLFASTPLDVIALLVGKHLDVDGQHKMRSLNAAWRKLLSMGSLTTLSTLDTDEAVLHESLVAPDEEFLSQVRQHQGHVKISSTLIREDHRCHPATVVNFFNLLSRVRSIKWSDRSSPSLVQVLEINPKRRIPRRLSGGIGSYCRSDLAASRRQVFRYLPYIWRALEDLLTRSAEGIESFELSGRICTHLRMIRELPSIRRVTTSPVPFVKPIVRFSRLTRLSVPGCVLPRIHCSCLEELAVWNIVCTDELWRFCALNARTLRKAEFRFAEPMCPFRVPRRLELPYLESLAVSAVSSRNLTLLARMRLPGLVSLSARMFPRTLDVNQSMEVVSAIGSVFQRAHALDSLTLSLPASFREVIARRHFAVSLLPWRARRPTFVTATGPMMQVLDLSGAEDIRVPRQFGSLQDTPRLRQLEYTPALPVEVIDIPSLEVLVVGNSAVQFSEVAVRSAKLKVFVSLSPLRECLLTDLTEKMPGLVAVVSSAGWICRTEAFPHLLSGLRKLEYIEARRMPCPGWRPLGPAARRRRWLRGWPISESVLRRLFSKDLVAFGKAPQIS
ncbi:MAG: uncharacterized protein KVP18_001421 [Porospora cf. gigantea A]|uniref:uncharacterized protein n=1 Tax=Porospora cf. gigantea A TaxID=2853593 RepID=UPI0035594781|nr:MAG: hypothetical protein KVP18_001421 [Porospora cf. gigantea A]